MINLRYHIVSVVAVFLALGIGLALGSTFVDSILVNELEDQVNEFKLDRDEAIRIKDQAVADQNSSLEDNEALRAEGVKQRQRHDEPVSYTHLTLPTISPGPQNSLPVASIGFPGIRHRNASEVHGFLT